MSVCLSVCPQLRNDVVSQANGSVTLHTKYHYDDMVSTHMYMLRHI